MIHGSTTTAHSVTPARRVTPRAGLTEYTATHRELLALASGPLVRTHEAIRPGLSAEHYLSACGERLSDDAARAVWQLIVAALLEVVDDTVQLTSHGRGVLANLLREHGLTVQGGGAS